MTYVYDDDSDTVPCAECGVLLTAISFIDGVTVICPNCCHANTEHWSGPRPGPNAPRVPPPARGRSEAPLGQVFDDAALAELGAAVLCARYVVAHSGCTKCEAAEATAVATRCPLEYGRVAVDNALKLGLIRCLPE